MNSMLEHWVRAGKRGVKRSLLALGIVALGCSNAVENGGPTATTASPLLVAGNVDFVVPVPPSAGLGDVVLGASSSIRLADRTVIESSGSGTPFVSNAGTVDTNVGADSRLTANIWSRSNVTLRERAFVSGSLTSAGTLIRQNATTVGGPILTQQALTARNVTFTVSFPQSSTDVILEPDQTRSIAPGAYANVNVKSRATLRVASGTYYIDAFNTEPLAKIALEGPGPFVFNVKTGFTYKGPFTFTGQAPQATSVLVAYAGTTDAFFQSPFEGTFIAPRANVILANIGTAPYRGSFFGKSLELQSSVRVIHKTASVGSVQPIAECQVKRDRGGYAAVFGYSATSPVGEVAIPIGAGNQFTPGAQDRGQPKRFANGRQRAQFLVESPGELLTWELDGKASTASGALPECTPECVQHVFDPNLPRISQLLASSPQLLSQQESIVVRDTFNWEDTLPVPELNPDGFPRLYYGQVFVDAKSTLDGLDVLRVHYSPIPVFEEEMLAIEQLDRSTRTFSYDFDGQGQFVFAVMPGALYNAIRAAALDPVEPTELFRAFQVRSIPTAEARASCGLAPKLECVAQAANGALSAVFGYDNPADNPVTIPAGADNALSGVTSPPAVPEAFAKGRHEAVFAVPFPTSGSVTWTLNGQSVTGRSTTARCSAAMAAKVGVDRYQPFAPQAGGVCRLRTPAETEFPKSSLPPTARVNTCSSFAYEYAGKVGMQWRNVADGEVDQRAEAAEQELLATDEPSSQSFVSDDGTPIQAFSIGKIFRKVVKKVVSVGKGAVDLTRRGLTQVARLFVGSRTVNVQVQMNNSDLWFRAKGDPGSSVMQRAWKDGGQIMIPGVEVRASYGPFLSLDHLNGQNRANVRVLNGLGARICFTAENGAAELINGWFMHPTQCDYNHPKEPSQSKIPGSGPDPIGGYPIGITDGYMNVLAQATDGSDYMKEVAGFGMKRPEIIVGTVANMIGSFNGNRAFTPCLSFSWANDWTELITVGGMVAGNHVADFVNEKGRTAARLARKGIVGATSDLAEGVAQAGLAATALAQTALAAEAQAVLNLATSARGAVDAAALASLKANQAADDARDALAQLARLQQTNSSRVAAAKALADAALEAQKTATEDARVAANAALDAVNAANMAAAQLASDAVGTAGEVASRAASVAIRVSGETLGNAAEMALTAATEATAAVAKGALSLVGAILGQVVGPVLDLFAGGDLILTNTSQSMCEMNPSPPPAFPPGGAMQPGLCFRSGDAPNRPTGRLVHDPDPHHTRALLSRNVPTHEYGHYVLCNLMERVSPGQFAAAYDEAAVDGTFGQTPEKEHAVFNEAFADLITSQVAGAVDYATPIGNLIPATELATSQYPVSFYCQSANPDLCIENNVKTRGTPGKDKEFNDGVSRMVTLFNDAFDGACFFAPGTPNNGKAWKYMPPGTTSNRVMFDSFGLSGRDETIQLPGSALPLWIRRGMARGSLLREANMFAGLSDVMPQGDANWCARCQVFKLHEPSGTCSEAVVGPRPPGTVCIDQQPAVCGACGARTPCGNDAECGEGNACFDGCCRDCGAFGTCETDVECGGGLLCSNRCCTVG
jgi:hypothetical protein